MCYHIHLVQFPAGISRHLTTQDLHSLQKCNGNTALTQPFFSHFSAVHMLSQRENVKKRLRHCSICRYIFVDYEGLEQSSVSKFLQGTVHQQWPNLIFPQHSDHLILRKIILARGPRHQRK